MLYNNICKVPFSEAEIHPNGDVYVCCPSKNSCPLGNIYKSSFDEIWYSDKAKSLRQDIIDGKYSKCNLKICNPLDNIEQDKLDLINEDVEISLEPPYPLYVKFCHDEHCNLKCITCRDDFLTNTTETTEKLNSYIDSVYLPILKNCKLVSLNGAGEVFASSHCKTLIKKIINTYPDIKFDLHTNGLLCTEKLCDELGITEKIISVDISMHAATKKTYDKIMLRSDYNKVVQNILWLSSLLKKGFLKKLDLYYVVQRMNYKEMIPFIKFAKSVNAGVYFWEYRNWGSGLGKYYNKVAVHEKDNPEYNKFVKMLQKPIFYEKHVHLNNLLKNLTPMTIKEKIEKYVKDILYSKFIVKIKRVYLLLSIINK